MRKLDFLKNKKTLILSTVLLIAILGVASTVALAVAKSNGVINSFKASKIDTSIDEEVAANLTKKVVVTNSSEAETDAYVRVRFSCTPEEYVQLILEDENGNPSVAESENGTQPWIDGGDGFYYYRYALAKGESTSQLLSKIAPKDIEPGNPYKGNMEVTVYQESCVASENIHAGDENAKAIDLTTLKSAFPKVESN